MTTKKILTLRLVYKDPSLLLGMKKVGFGQGRWNGFGGKVKEGELIEDAAKRELKEECNLRVLSMDKRGILNFTFEGGHEKLEVHLFQITDFEGEPVETNEMKPQWFSKDEIPFDEMWPDDKHWMPLFLAGKKFRADFYFLDYNTLMCHNIEEL